MTPAHKKNLISNHVSQKNGPLRNRWLITIKNVLIQHCSLYYDQYGFTKYNPPTVHIFDNESLAGGWVDYYRNTFYLNVADWKHDTKYAVETLTLHETIPGHHPCKSTIH